ncbi:MAG: InlB B-repeat-containing protein [Clostridia bacterium]|nr:InlB B-repeat-containing protein [Clostridia bacterium]
MEYCEHAPCMMREEACGFGREKGKNVRPFWYAFVIVPIIIAFILYGIGSCLGCEACFECGAACDTTCDGCGMGCDMEDCGRECYEEGACYACQNDQVAVRYPSLGGNSGSSYHLEVDNNRTDYSEWLWKGAHNQKYFDVQGAFDDNGTKFIDANGKRVKDFDKVVGELHFKYTEKALGRPYIFYFGENSEYDVSPVSATVGQPLTDTPDVRPTKEGEKCIGWETANEQRVISYSDNGYPAWSYSEFHLYNFNIDPSGVSNTITLYPVWEKITYNVTFVAQNRTQTIGAVPYQTTFGQIKSQVEELTQNLDNAEFLGWALTQEAQEYEYLKDDYVITDNVQIYAILKEYVSFTFYYNDGTDATVDPKPQGYIGQTAFIFPTVEENYRRGYKFTGWCETSDASDTATAISSIGKIDKKTALTYYARWEPAKYKIEYYDPETSTIFTKYSTEYYSYGEGAELLTAEEIEYKCGYTFAGWFLNEDLTGDKYTTLSTDDYGDKKLYAKYDSKAVTVNLVQLIGTISSNKKTIQYGLYYTLPVPVMDGWEFQGWQYSVDGSNYVTITDNDGDSLKPFTFANLGLTGIDTPEEEETYLTITYRALWMMEPHTVKFYDGDTEYTDLRKSIENGTTVSTPLPPQKTGYTFLGWYTAKTDGEAYDFAKPVTADLQLYARFNAISYVVILNANSGTFDDSTTAKVSNATYDDAAFEWAVPTREGFKFLGWEYDGTLYTSENGKAVKAYNVTEDQATFTAKWQRTVFTLTLMSMNGNNEIATVTWVRGSSNKIDFTPNDSTDNGLPTNGNHLFLGWYSQATGGTAHTDVKGSFTTALTEEALLALDIDDDGNITLYAQWM